MKLINYIKKIREKRKVKKYKADYYQKNKKHIDKINKIARNKRIEKQKYEQFDFLWKAWIKTI